MVEHVFVWEGCSAKQSCFGPDSFFLWFFFFFFLTRKSCSCITKCYLVMGANKKIIQAASPPSLQRGCLLDIKAAVCVKTHTSVSFLGTFLSHMVDFMNFQHIPLQTTLYIQLIQPPQNVHFLEDSPHLQSHKA